MTMNNFSKVICKKCKTKNIIFDRATTIVKCPKCNVIQTVPKGGKCGFINCTVEDGVND